MKLKLGRSLLLAAIEVALRENQDALRGWEEGGRDVVRHAIEMSGLGEHHKKMSLQFMELGAPRDLDGVLRDATEALMRGPRWVECEVTIENLIASQR